MKTPEKDLNERLPQGVLSDLGSWTTYQNFRAFTWPWLVRRGAVFWPLAVLAGSAYAAWHSSSMGLWTDWPGLALHACLASLIAVTAGPLFATAIRYLRLPVNFERVMVILAILLGLWIGAAALDWAGAYHDHLMQRDIHMRIDPWASAVARFLSATIDASTIASSRF